MKLKPFTDVTSYQITSRALRMLIEMFVLQKKKNIEACQTSGGPTNRWLNAAYARVAEVTQTPRKSDNKGIWCQDGVTGLDSGSVSSNITLFYVGPLNSQLGWETEDVFIVFSHMGGLWEKEKCLCVCVLHCGDKHQSLLIAQF